MTLSDPFSQAAAGTPNPSWDFAPDTVSVVRGIPVPVVNQGGEPHTFTEVQKFVGGFIPGLNDGQETVPRVRQRFRQSEGPDHPSAAGQPASDHWPVEGNPLLPVLHPSVDAHASHHEVTWLFAMWSRIGITVSNCGRLFGGCHAKEFACGLCLGGLVRGDFG